MMTRAPEPIGSGVSFVLGRTEVSLREESDREFRPQALPSACSMQRLVAGKASRRASEIGWPQISQVP